MPLPSLSPPGGIDLHIAIAVLTPAILAAVGAVACLIVGERRGVRTLGWIVISSALALHALMLRPGGAAGQFPQPIAGGSVRIAWAPLLLSYALACWAAWRWRPARGGRPWAWCLRAAFALALPLLRLPPLTLVAEIESDPTTTWLRWSRAVATVLACALLPWWPGTAHAVACLAMAGAGGPWRWPLIATAAVAMLPPAWGG